MTITLERRNDFGNNTKSEIVFGPTEIKFKQEETFNNSKLNKHMNCKISCDEEKYNLMSELLYYVSEYYQIAADVFIEKIILNQQKKEGGGDII